MFNSFDPGTRECLGSVLPRPLCALGQGLCEPLCSHLSSGMGGEHSGRPATCMGPGPRLVWILQLILMARASQPVSTGPCYSSASTLLLKSPISIPDWGGCPFFVPSLCFSICPCSAEPALPTAPPVPPHTHSSYLRVPPRPSTHLTTSRKPSLMPAQLVDGSCSGVPQLGSPAHVAQLYLTHSILLPQATETSR